MIIDYTIFRRFLDIIPDLENDEVYFVSLSARHKYLTPEEREYFNLGRTEMFGREIARSKADLESTLHKMQVLHDDYYTTRNGKRIPFKALVVYININPSSMIKAYNEFKKETDNELAEILQALQNGRTPDYDGMQLLDRRLKNCIQKARSRRILIDVDFDTKEQSILNNFLNTLSFKPHVVKTKSGYHVLLNLNDLRQYKYNLYDHVQIAHEQAKQSGGEVIINRNGMIPLPGTNQAGRLVTFFP